MGALSRGHRRASGADPAAPLVAAWNGTAWENIGTALEEDASNPQIRALTSGDGYLVAVGQFPFLGGAALFDGTKWTILTDMNFMEDSALLRSEGLYLGGDFNLVDGKPAVGVALLRRASPCKKATLGGDHRRRRRQRRVIGPVRASRSPSVAEKPSYNPTAGLVAVAFAVWRQPVAASTPGSPFLFSREHSHEW